MKAFVALLINLVILAIVAYALFWVVTGIIGLAIPAIIIKLVGALFVLWGLGMVLGFVTGNNYVPMWNPQPRI